MQVWTTRLLNICLNLVRRTIRMKFTFDITPDDQGRPVLTIINNPFSEDFGQKILTAFCESVIIGGVGIQAEFITDELLKYDFTPIKVTKLIK